MLKHTLMITASIAALALVAPAQASWINDALNPDIAKVRQIEPRGGEFRDYLAREYRGLALFEADAMYDLDSSDYFADKGLSVYRGNDEIPAVPQIWNVDDRYMKDLTVGREMLTTTFDNGARTIAPERAAIAQAKYDCWVEQMSEGYSAPWQAGDIADCRQAFFNAMDNLHAAIAAAQAKEKLVVVLPPKPEPIVTPEPAASYVPVGETTTVYFDFDQADITPDAQIRIDKLVARLNGGENIALTVEGYADRAGPKDYNRKLSEKRAVAVRDELLRRGLDVQDVEKMNIKAEGETDPAVETPDGVRHPLNRRAKITAYRLELSGTDSEQVSMNRR